MEQTDNPNDNDNKHHQHHHPDQKQIKNGDKKMTDLEAAVWRYITKLVYTENRPFDYLDVVPEFGIDGIKYTISYGTFRNIVSKWVRDERLEVVEYSPQALYSIKGFKLQKPTTVDHTGVEPPNINQLLLQELLQPSTKKYSRRITNHPVYRIIRSLPFDKTKLHNWSTNTDLRLCFWEC